MLHQTFLSSLNKWKGWQEWLPDSILPIYNRIFKDTGLYTIVIPSTSPHPTPLERRRKGTHDSSWVDVLFQYHFGCHQVRIEMSLSLI
jgi:hypothetical protein